MISVVVADDHPFVLHGVANVLRSNSEITVVTACNDGSAAWSCQAVDAGPRSLEVCREQVQRNSHRRETPRCRVSHQRLVASALLRVACLRIRGG